MTLLQLLPLLQGLVTITTLVQGEANDLSVSVESALASPEGGGIPQVDLSDEAIVGARETLSCWSCSASSSGPHCYDLPPSNATLPTPTLLRNCSQHELFCSVKRIWYLVEGKAEVRDFSINRTCAATCHPSCMVIGDRTKIYSCTSCCSEPLCNTGSWVSPLPRASPLLLLIALLAPTLPAPAFSLLPHTFMWPRQLVILSCIFFVS